jgi:hypothetical protein
MKKRPARILIRNFALELLLYGVLIVAYTAIVLQWLSEPLKQLFNSNLTTYAFLGLGLIVAQGALLDRITSFLINLLKLERLE